MTLLPPPSVPSTPAGWYPDAASGRQRWWDGTRWTDHFHDPMPAAPQPGWAHAAPVYGNVEAAARSNGYATASLVLGICGFVLMGIPFFIGWFLGGIPDILAVIFGIVALNNAAGRAGIGRGSAIVGLCLGGVSLLAVFIGAGSIW